MKEMLLQTNGKYNEKMTREYCLLKMTVEKKGNQRKKHFKRKGKRKKEKMIDKKNDSDIVKDNK